MTRCLFRAVGNGRKGSGWARGMVASQSEVAVDTSVYGGVSLVSHTG